MPAPIQRQGHTYPAIIAENLTDKISIFIIYSVAVVIMGFFDKLFKKDDSSKYNSQPENSPVFWVNKGIDQENVAQRYWLQERYDDANYRYKQAIECYQKAIYFDPNFADAWYRAGQSYFGMGSSIDNDEMFKKAIEYCSKAIEIDPNNPALKTNAEDVIGKATRLLNYKK
jgi:tetratricopeptide (TPR) repeat protein